MRRRELEQSARSIAASVVHAVVCDGAFVAKELDQQLLLHPDLDARDRALATELAYGVVRCFGALKSLVEARASKGVKDRRVLSHLLVAAYQLCLLERVPPFAAVNEAVSSIRALSGERVAGFANAVLRGLAKGPKLERARALKESVPAWLWQALVRGVNEEQALALLGATEHATAPETCARFLSQDPLPSWAESGEPGRYLPSVRRFRRSGDLRRHPEWEQGAFVVQEEGAALCGYALAVRAGERVLDACAGRGNKTSLLRQQLGDSGELWATDQQPLKLLQLEDEFRRLKLVAPKTQAVDWTQPDASVPNDFDRVLVDAPCTGTGTLRHRPEIVLRLSADDVERLALKSEAILKNAAHHAKPGGTVLYVVCSALERECEEVVRRVSGADLAPEPFEAEALRSLAPPNATSFRLLPGVHGTDGYFLANFRRLPRKPPPVS